MLVFVFAIKRLACCFIVSCSLTIAYTVSMLSLTEVIADDFNATATSHGEKARQEIASMVTSSIIRSQISIPGSGYNFLRADNVS